jgi:transcriptional regulator with XRE-family HTH domain
MTTAHKARYCRCGARLARDNPGARCSACTAADRDRLAAAPEMPADFWDEVVLQEALASRHMGRVIRAWRTHPHHGRQDFPQDRVAPWAGVTQTQLSRIENGQPMMHLDRLIQWARVLRIPADRLWFAMPDSDRPFATGLASAATEAPDVTEAASAVAVGASDALIVAEIDPVSAWVASDTVELVSGFSREDLSLDRREATRTIAGVVVGGALLERLERWLSPPQPTVTRRRTPGIGHQEVEQIEHAARLFRTWDDQFGGGLRRKAVVGELSEVADELRDFTHPADLTRRLFGVMAQLAETAATMSWDSGQGTVAQRYYVMALRAAKEAGDRAFGANILAGMARQQFYLGHVAEGLELVRLAQDGVDGHATPTIRAMLHTREAWAYAKQGRLSAFGRATTRAEDCLRDALPADDPYWISYFDEAELAGVTGGRLLDVAHHRSEYAEEAASCIGRAVQLRRAQSVRSAALDQLGKQATQTVDRTHSDRVRVKLAELYGHTEPYVSVSLVAELRDRITVILNAPNGLPAGDEEEDRSSWQG